MRADRLLAALMILQAKGQVTAADLATELEVSTRTARRDLEALAMSGVPIYSQPGRGGGWRLIGGATTDLTGLSSSEAHALFLALGSHAKTNPALDAALRKLIVALPDRFRSDAMAASSAIKVDTAGWGQVGVADRPVFVDELSRAVIGGRQVTLTYATPGSEPSDRVVHPLGLVTKRGVWYLVANTARGMRTYRLSRVHAVHELDAPVDRPDDFDLAEAWTAIVAEVEHQRFGVTVEAWVAPAALGPLSYVFARRHEITQERDDNGWHRAEISAQSPTGLAGQLAGFGANVRLIDPPEQVADAMRNIAAALAQVWL